jgi:hypothetical protein
MKVEEKSVHYNKYNGCCMKQWVYIPKAFIILLHCIFTISFYDHYM